MELVHAPEGLVHALERFRRFYHYYSRKAEMFVDIIESKRNVCGYYNKESSYTWLIIKSRLL